MTDSNVYTLLVGYEAEYYDRGMMAFDDGDDIDDNPYLYGSMEAVYWARGWQDAREF